MVKKIIISIFMALSISSMAFAGNIGVINTEKLRIESKAGQSIFKQITALQDKFKIKFDSLQKDFDGQKLELDKQKTVLSKEAFAKKEAEFNNKLAEARKQMQQEASNMEQMQQTAFAEFNTAAMAVISDIAKDGKYTQIFPAELLIYVDTKSDITSQVIAGLDKKVDNITLKAPDTKK